MIGGAVDVSTTERIEALESSSNRAVFPPWGWKPLIEPAARKRCPCRRSTSGMGACPLAPAPPAIRARRATAASAFRTHACPMFTSPSRT